VFGFPLLSISIALVVTAAASPSSVIGRHSVPGVRTLATGAYSLYLSQKLAYHLVIVGVIPSFGLTGAGHTLVAIAAALVFATALYWAVERPFLMLRDRLDGPSRSPIAVKVDAD
jgi:peptidoglycan/LPS O-acetylase OafA/YrhL